MLLHKKYRRFEKMNELSEEARAKRNEYHRRWSAANRDKLKAAQRRYWERRARQEPENPEQARNV